MPQLVIIAERVQLGIPGDNMEGPVMGGFAYALPEDGIDYAVNVHDVHVDKDLGSFANVSVLYVIPDEVAQEVEEAEGQVVQLRPAEESTDE